MAGKLLLLVTTLSFAFGSISLSRADSGSVDTRDIVVDNALGGMREGSRIVSPDTYDKKTQIPKIPGTHLSPSIDTRVVTGAPVADASRAGISSAAASLGVSSGVNEGTSGSVGALPGTDAGALGSGVGEGESLGGGTVIPGDSGLGTDLGSGGSGTADSTAGSLIDIDTSVDLSSGSVDAGVSLDTDNTDKILEADLTAGADETAGITGSSDIAAGDITADSSLPAEITESPISSETDIGTEVDTSGATIGGEADIGIEADVEGGSEGDDVADDPADGLPAPGL